MWQKYQKGEREDRETQKEELKQCDTEIQLFNIEFQNTYLQ